MYIFSVNGSIWVEGGSIEYSEMHEAAPYWLYVHLSMHLLPIECVFDKFTAMEWFRSPSSSMINV